MQTAISILTKTKRGQFGCISSKSDHNNSLNFGCMSNVSKTEMYNEIKNAELLHT